MSEIYSGTGIFSSLSDFFGQTVKSPGQTESKSSSFVGKVEDVLKAHVWIFPVWVLILMLVIVIIAVVML